MSARHLRTAFVLTISAVALVGCRMESSDGAFMVAVRNDTDAPVIVVSCENWGNDKKCAKKWTDDGVKVKPGKAASVMVHGNSAPWEEDAIPGELTIKDAASGDKLGCIPYEIAEYYVDDSVKFDASQAQGDACGSKDYVEPAADGVLFCDSAEGRTLPSCD